MARPELLRLLHACKQEPGADAARLVLADWLEEFGDADDRERAAFVRLEVSSGPRNGRPAFSGLLQQRWKASQKRWAPFHSESTPARSERGLVRAQPNPKVANGPRAVKTAASEAWAWVESVSLERPKAETLASPLLDSPSAIQIANMHLEAASIAGAFRPAWRSLALQQCLLSDGLLPLLDSPGASGLRSLDVADCVFDAAGIPALLDADRMPGLEGLSIQRRDPDIDAWMAALAGSRRRLRSFSARVGHGKAFLRTLAEADACAGLRHLRLEDVSGQFSALPAFRFLPELRSLEVDQSNLAPASDWLERCPESPLLRRLAFKWAALKPAAIRALGASPLVASLTELDLSSNGIGLDGARMLATFPASPRALCLANNVIDDEGAKALAAWPGLASCRFLNLSNNRIGDEGIEALARSPDAAGLAGLRLDHNRISDKGAARLLAADWIVQLEQLDLNCNQISEGLGPALLSAKLGAMKELVLGDDALGMLLRRELPHIPCIE